MMQFFLNPLMLAGLAGIGLPIVAHLLSRRKYDVVQWGAMQFLNPSRKTRRKLKLEELLLLLVRIAAIAALAFAAARPWINSGFLTGYRSAGSRDIVLVIDGSNSMARNDGLGTVHRRAVQLAGEFLDSLSPGDAVAVVDARDQPVTIVESPLQDLELVREQLTQIPDPAGAANLQRACEEAIGILGRSSAGAREVVVLTDRQRSGWNPADAASWKRFDEVMSFPSIRPDVWVVDVTEGLGSIRKNVSVGAIDLARDLTVPGFPVGLQVPVINSGDQPVTVPLQVLINGQRVAAMDDSITIPAASQTTFSRSVQFDAPGTNLISVRAIVSDDSIDVDNDGHAAIQVAKAIPALLVHGPVGPQAANRSTFFAELALTAPGNETPWVQATSISSEELQESDLRSVAVVVLSDVSQLTEEQCQHLQDFAARGNGILICVGNRMTAAQFENVYLQHSLWPAPNLQRIRQVDPDAATPVTIAPYSLEASWLNRFRERKGASLLRASFREWWVFDPTSPAEGDGTSVESDRQTAAAIDQSSGKSQAQNSGAGTRPSDQTSRVSSATPLARLSTGDPVLLQAPLGQGTVMLLASSLDPSMNNLPAMPDYVPFLHEAIFQMASSGVARNVNFGQPLLTVIEDQPSNQEADPDSPTFQFVAPDERRLDATVGTHVSGWQVQLARTRLPGAYQLKRGEADVLVDRFVVNYDHREDDPTELVEAERLQLSADERLRFVPSVEELAQKMYGDESRTELWAALLWFFLALLTIEVWLTRRLVLRGHADPPPVQIAQATQA